jgi:hypothetical protein
VKCRPRPFGVPRPHPTPPLNPSLFNNRVLLGNSEVRSYPAGRPVPGTVVVYCPLTGDTNMSELANPLFWSMKIKIAILTFATFAALC